MGTETVRLPSFIPKDMPTKTGKSVQSLLTMLRIVSKSMLDRFAALIGLILLAPFFAIVAVILKKDSPGPIFYWGPRVGRNGKIFKMLKFRTMYEEPVSYDGPRVTVKGDKRITPFGNWLRYTKANELPQLWNVLIGEMSLVGPRPEDPEVAADWPEDASQEILSVNPGITSPASILYRDEESLLASNDVMGSYFDAILPNKMRLDQLYVRNLSFFTDLDIIFWTFAIIIPRLVKTQIPEVYLFSGPIFRLAHRYVNWFFVDWMTSFLSVAFVALIWRMKMVLDWGPVNSLILAFCVAFFFSGFNLITGLNRIDWPKATLEDLLLLALSGAFVTLLLLVTDYLELTFRILRLPSLPIGMVFAIGVVAFGGLFITRYRWRLLTFIARTWITWRSNRSKLGEKILIVGSGEGFRTATWLLRRQKIEYAYTVVGVVDDNDVLSKQDLRSDGYRILGRLQDIPALIKKHDVGLVIFTTSLIPAETQEYVNNLSKSSKVRQINLDKLLKLVDNQFNFNENSIANHSNINDNLEFFATHHELTGLPNQYLFKTRLKHSIAYAKRYQSDLAVILIDLGGHHSIEKKHGRDNGIKVLKEAAERLAKRKRDSDTLAYLGDYKFGMILENIQDIQMVDMIAYRISQVFEEPFYADGKVCRLDVELEPFRNTKECEEFGLLEKLSVGI